MKHSRAASAGAQTLWELTTITSVESAGLHTRSSDWSQIRPYNQYERWNRHHELLFPLAQYDTTGSGTWRDDGNSKEPQRTRTLVARNVAAAVMEVNPRLSVSIRTLSAQVMLWSNRNDYSRCSLFLRSPRAAAGCGGLTGHVVLALVFAERRWGSGSPWAVTHDTDLDGSARVAVC